jgi:tRNA pseudouridine13 synthase
VDVHAETPVRSILEELSRRGVPNYFGPQRQGRAGANYRTGAALLHGEQGRGRMSRQQRLWALHAYQAFLFNRMVALRIDRIDRVFAGDWAMKHANGACFVVENPEVEQARADRFEISPTGVLFGSRAPWASGEPGALERQAVAELGETPEALTRAAAEHGFRGERRPLRVPMEELRWSISGRDLTLAFALPPGAYATSVLREVMKNDG